MFAPPTRSNSDFCSIKICPRDVSDNSDIFLVTLGLEIKWHLGPKKWDHVGTTKISTVTVTLSLGHGGRFTFHGTNSVVAPLMKPRYEPVTREWDERTRELRHVLCDGRWHTVADGIATVDESAGRGRLHSDLPTLSCHMSPRVHYPRPVRHV